MLTYAFRRIVQSIAVIVVMSMLVFFGIYIVGNPVDLLISPQASEADRLRALSDLGLDRPIVSQYLTFLNGLLHGELGRSFVHNVPALNLILQRFPATLELAFSAIVIAIVFGIPMGLFAGLRPESSLARIISTASILGFSLPSFWVGLMLIMIFSVGLGWLPATGRGNTAIVFGIETSLATWDGIRHLILPACNLAIFKLALITRLARAGTQEVALTDYVKFARAKGLSETRVVLVHVLSNIIIPIITVVGLELGSVISFAVVTETIFAWPGTGKLIIDSINLLDRPVIVGYLMLVVTLFILINLVVDLLYSFADPRIRLGDSR